MRVVSERLSAEEAQRARATPSVTRFASHSAASQAASALTTVLPGVHDPVPGTTVLRTTPGYGPGSWPQAPGLPVLAPHRPRRRVAELVRLVFARRRTGRHRPEATPSQSWSMFAPRRPARRWGRR